MMADLQSTLFMLASVIQTKSINIIFKIKAANILLKCSVIQTKTHTHKHAHTHTHTNTHTDMAIANCGKQTIYVNRCYQYIH